MAKIKGPRKVHSYGTAFRIRAVQLSHIPGVQVQEVAKALEIHPFLLYNAHMESFFHSMKADGVHGVSFKDGRAATGFVRGYMPFYNNRRLHSSLGYMTPVEFESRILKLARVY